MLFGLLHGRTNRKSISCRMIFSSVSIAIRLEENRIIFWMIPMSDSKMFMHYDAHLKPGDFRVFKEHRMMENGTIDYDLKLTIVDVARDWVIARDERHMYWIMMHTSYPTEVEDESNQLSTRYSYN